MAYARTSQRAEQRALRQKMRALGLSHRQIAVEFARRYGLRPRAAWRHAYGWSLKEAAEQINGHACDADLDPGGSAAMTGPHLCEYENWPGPGPESAGRRPTPLVLALLAATYDTSVHDLLDLADYERLPPGDRLILERIASPKEHRCDQPTASPAPWSRERPRGQRSVVIAEAPRDERNVGERAAVSWVKDPAKQESLCSWDPAGQFSVASRPPDSALHKTRGVVWPGPGYQPFRETTPVLNPDEIRHLVAAMENARRYADSAVARYVASQLAACAASDGVRGPKETLPLVLAMVAAIDYMAREAKPTARCSLLAAGARSAEFAGWLFRDSAAPDLAGYWHDRAAEWAQLAGDRGLQGYVLLKRSQVAWDERDAQRMLMLAQAAQDSAWETPPRVRAEAAQQEARSHAMLGGDLGLVEAKLDQARHLLTEQRPTGSRDAAPLAAHYSASLLAMQTAICYNEAGQPARAVEIYEEHLTAEAFSHRDYGYFRALAGIAVATTGRPDDGAAAGREALRIAANVGSRRTLRELTRLLERLRPWPGRPEVRAFREELAASINRAP